MKKKLIAFLTASTMLFTMSISAYAAQYEFTHKNGTKTTPGEVIAQGKAGEILAQKQDYKIELKDGKQYNLADYLVALKDNPTFTEDQIIEKLNENAAEELKVVSVSAINAKSLKVNFSKAISKEDQAKVTFEVKRDGNINIVLNVKWAEDGNSATLSSAANLVAGDYAVTAKGLEFKEASATTKVAEVEATALAIKSTTLNDNTVKAKINLVLQNQYEEEMPFAAADFNVTALKVTQGGAATVTFDGTDKYFYIDTQTDADAFKVDDVVRVTFLHKATGFEATADLKVVSGAFVDSITFGEIELPKGKTILTANLKEVKIPYVAKDQFANDIDLAIGTNVDVISSDETVLKASDVSLVTEDKVTKLKIASFQKAGDVTLTAMAKLSGKSTKIKLSVQKAPGEVAKVVVAQSEITIAKGSKGYIGLEVTDFYGEKIDPKDYKDKLTFASSNPAVVENPIANAIQTSGVHAGKAEINVLGTADKNATAKISINVEGKEAASFVVKAGEEAAPSYVKVKSDTIQAGSENKLVKGAVQEINFIVEDQYQNVLSSAAGYTVNTKIKDGTADVIALSAETTAVGSAKVTATAKKAGQEVLVVELKKAAKVVHGIEIPFTVIANNASLELSIADIPVLYVGGSAGYEEPVQVKAADGAILPQDNILSVTSANPSVLVVDGKKVKGSNHPSLGEDTTVEITVLYSADDGIVTLKKEVLVSAKKLVNENIQVVSKEQNSGTDVFTQLKPDTQEVLTINVEDFDALDAYNQAFAIVQDNFKRMVNAKTSGIAHNVVEVKVDNQEGYQEDGTADQVTIQANGQIKFANFADNVVSSADGKASLRLTIYGGGKAKAVQINVAKRTKKQRATELAQAAIQGLALANLGFDNAEASQPVIRMKDLPVIDGVAFTLANPQGQNSVSGALQTDDTEIKITRAGGQGTLTFRIKATGTVGGVTGEAVTELFTVTVPAGTTPVAFVE